MFLFVKSKGFQITVLKKKMWGKRNTQILHSPSVLSPLHSSDYNTKLHIPTDTFITQHLSKLPPTRPPSFCCPYQHKINPRMLLSFASTVVSPEVAEPRQTYGEPTDLLRTNINQFERVTVCAHWHGVLFFTCRLEETVDRLNLRKKNQIWMQRFLCGLTLKACFFFQPTASIWPSADCVLKSHMKLRAAQGSVILTAVRGSHKRKATNEDMLKQT